MKKTSDKKIIGFIASDHKGFKIKEALKKEFPLIDLGPFNEESVDYPDYAKKVCKYVLKEHSKGVLICGSGIGMSICANRFKGIRAALCFTPEMAELSKLHNDANILVLSGQLLNKRQGISIARKFFNTEFSNEERHIRRIKKLDQHI